MSLNSISAQLCLPTNIVEAACWRVAIRTVIVLNALHKPVNFFTPAQLGRIAAAVNEHTPADMDEALNPEAYQFAVARMYPGAGKTEKVIPSQWLILGIHAAFDSGRTDMLGVDPGGLVKGLVSKLAKLPGWFNVSQAMLDAAYIIEGYTDSITPDVAKFLEDGWRDRHEGEVLRWLDCYSPSTIPGRTN